MPPVKVACCQLSLALGSQDANRDSAASAIERVARDGAKVIVLPELTPSGYRFSSREELSKLAEPPNGPTVEGWRRLAEELGVVIAGGFPEMADDGHVYNSAVIVDEGGVLALHRKTHLWDEEPNWFAFGESRPPVVDTAYGRIGLAVCYELEFPELVRSVALEGAQLLCAPVNWPLFPRPRSERPIEVVNSQAGAAANRMFVAVCDRAGPERGTEWLGGGVIIDPDGYPMTDLRLGEEADFTARLDLDEALDKAIGDRNDVHADRRPELYRNPATRA